MSDYDGRFVWYELITTDPEAAKGFYAKAVGWTMEASPMPDMTYILAKDDKGGQVAGVMAIPPEAKAMGVPPNWTGYVAVDDVDAAAAKAKSLGGSVMREPTDIPNIGRFAIVADPQGAVVALFKGAPSDQGPTLAQDAAGHVGWHELMTSDLDGAVAFYSAMFGWTKGEAHDMGPMGVYQIFQAGDHQLGGMMTKPPQVPVSAWGYYFNAGPMGAAADRVKAAGGQVLNGPMEVPGGSWIVQGQDPQGAMFALIGTAGS